MLVKGSGRRLHGGASRRGTEVVADGARISRRRNPVIRSQRSFRVVRALVSLPADELICSRGRSQLVLRRSRLLAFHDTKVSPLSPDGRS